MEQNYSPPNAAVSASRGLDFYNYINHDWQVHAKIMPYDSSFSVSDEIETRVEDSLFKIIDDIVKNKPATPFAQLVKSVTVHKYQANNVYDVQRLSAMLS